MRRIEEIKADLKDCYSCESKACLFPETTHCGKPQDESVVTYEAEMGKALINLFGLDRLEEICNAEREGRCVVLPCKLGDTVYTIEEQIYNCKNCEYVGESHFDKRAHMTWCNRENRRCPIGITKHIVEGFEISGDNSECEISAPGEWEFYEGFHQFAGADGKYYLYRGAAEQALKEREQ